MTAMSVPRLAMAFALALHALPARSQQDGHVDRFRLSLGQITEQSPLASAEVPQVPCPKDGQGGPVDPPELPASKRLVLPLGTAGSLAFYTAHAQGSAGVLAPRGWSCHGLYGSNGDVLVVQPLGSAGDPRDASYRGQFVLRSFSDGGTSGRFEVARVGGRLFPQARAFAEQVKAEGIDDDPFPDTPWPSDRIERLGDGAVAFETPGGVEGLGRQGKGPYAPEPVSGAVAYAVSADGDPFLVQLKARLDRNIYPAVAIAFLDDLRPALERAGRPRAPSPASGPGDGALAAVRAFYEALGRADGETASGLVVPERRASGPYAPSSISRFYGSLAEPIRLLSATAAGGGDVEVRYRYRKPNGAVCDGRAVVATRSDGGAALIARIKPLNGC